MAFTHIRRAHPAHTLERSLPPAHAGQAGFTLIELLVVTAIIVVITGVVLVNNNRFGGVVLLENLAYDVALTVRQAQVYGISVARFGPDTFSAGYGIDFDLNSPNAYVLFADLSENGVYDCTTPGGVDCELVGSNTIASGYQISQLCVTPAGQAEVCTGIERVNILFRRPEPDAWISYTDQTSDYSCILDNGTCRESSRIILTSPRADEISIVVDANGQISVRKPHEL